MKDKKNLLFVEPIEALKSTSVSSIKKNLKLDQIEERKRRKTYEMKF